MASECWYEVYTYGASEEEKQKIYKRILSKYQIQDFNGDSEFEWGGSWDEMEDIMQEISGEFPHVLFVVTVDCKSYEDGLADKFYFGMGEQQENVTVDCRIDAVSERLLHSNLKREKLPDHLLCGGSITATGAGTLIRITPKVEDGVLFFSIEDEEGGVKNTLSCQISDLLGGEAVSLTNPGTDG